MAIVTDYTAILDTSIAPKPGTAVFYTYSFASAPPTYLTNYSAAQLATFQPLTDAQKDIARTALNLWASVSGITLFEVTKGVGDINFGVYDLAALGSPNAAGFAYLGSDSRYGITSDVFLTSSGASSLHVVLHEVGHALGLKHSFEGTTTLDPTLDNFAHTVMSYTSGGTPGTVLGSLDLAAIQYLYGANSSDGSQIASWTWDAAGETLTQTGGVAAETILGVAARDIISGNGGDDTIDGGSGGDLLDGGDGNDTINAVVAPGFGAVSLLGGAGNDNLSITVMPASTAGFAVDGGSGTDTLTIIASGDLSLSAAGVQLTNLEQVYVQGTDTGERLIGSPGSEQIQGWGGADFISTLGGNDVIFAGDGNDTLIGGVGADYLSGDAGTDRFLYLDATDSLAAAPDTIADFVSGTDFLDISAFPLWDLAISGSGGSFAVSGVGLAGSFRVAVRGTITLTDVVRQNVGIHLAGGSGNDGLTGSGGSDFLEGGGGSDTLSGLGGRDYLSGDAGNDTLDGGAGTDLAIYTATRGTATVTRNGDRSLSVATSLEGTDTVRHVEQVQFADGLYSFTFANPGAAVVANFNPANGWTSQDFAPRHVADVNGDGFGDIVGFGTAGVLVSLGSANGNFSQAGLASGNFGQTAGWLSDNQFHRVLADVNGDGRADIIGFGQAGTLVALAKADGTFGNPVLGLADFGASQGWLSDAGFHRVVADVNGDGRADIVGFGQSGTLVALGNGDGTFRNVAFGIANFGVAQGWTSDTIFHREAADVNGDGLADLIGFGQAGTLVALGNGDGTFGSVRLTLANFGATQGWASNDSFPRLLADVNGDHVADIVGFGASGTLVAYGKGDGTFTDIGNDLANFGAAQGWTSDATFHREVFDINHDGLADIVGFGAAGVLVGSNQGDFII